MKKADLQSQVCLVVDMKGIEPSTLRMRTVRSAERNSSMRPRDEKKNSEK